MGGGGGRLPGAARLGSQYARFHKRPLGAAGDNFTRDFQTSTVLIIHRSMHTSTKGTGQLVPFKMEERLFFQELMGME